MKRFVPATFAIFHRFQLVGMGLFVTGGNVIVFLAFGAGKDDLIAFAVGHKSSLFFLFSQALVYHKAIYLSRRKSASFGLSIKKR